MASGRHDARVQQRVAAAQALGFNGTPSFQFVQQASGKTYTLVGAQPVDVFTAWIDALLAGKEPPQAKQPNGKPELPLWAKPEGLAPDPKRPGFTVAGDPYKGNPDAKLVVVEFGDFECPALPAPCPDDAAGAGQAVRRDRRGPVGRQALPAADPSARPCGGRGGGMCAGDQGKFWAMHHGLFERMEQWANGNDPDAALGQLRRTSSWIGPSLRLPGEPQGPGACAARSVRRAERRGEEQSDLHFRAGRHRDGGRGDAPCRAIRHVAATATRQSAASHQGRGDRQRHSPARPRRAAYWTAKVVAALPGHRHLVPSASTYSFRRDLAGSSRYLYVATAARAGGRGPGHDRSRTIS